MFKRHYAVFQGRGPINKSDSSEAHQEDSPVLVIPDNREFPDQMNKVSIDSETEDLVYDNEFPFLK